MGIIELTGLTKRYESGQDALRDVTLTINPQEFVFVVGPSGAGKSTLIKLLMLEELPTSGGVVVDGCDLTRLRPRDIPYYRRKLGVAFQDFRLIPTMTVYDNVAFAMRVINAPDREIRRRVPQVLEQMGILSKAKRYPEHLSGGEQQRVGIARALVNQPAIIIADEPTGSIDPDMGFEVVELLSRICKERGTTVLMVTHNLELVLRFNQRTIVLEGGRVIKDGWLRRNGVEGLEK